MFLSVIAALSLFNVALCDECASSHIDECGAQIWPFLLDPNITPANEEELNKICLSIRAGEKCLVDFTTKCPILSADIRNGVIDSLKSTIDDFCNGNLGKRFLPHGLCMKQNLAKNFTCNQDAIDLFEAAAVFEPVSDRLKHTCCSYLSLDKCYTGSVKAVCQPQAARVMRNLMQSYSLFMVEKCLPYLADADKCNLDLLKGLKPINGRKMKTFLPALFDVAAVSF